MLLLLINRGGGEVGLLMRTDKEAAVIFETMPKYNVDLSTLGDHMSNGDEFLAKVAEYSEIHTDRLHVCIAGLVVGAKVNLYPGSYFKIKSIYDSSISGNFNNVFLNKKCDDVHSLSVSIFG